MIFFLYILWNILSKTVSQRFYLLLSTYIYLHSQKDLIIVLNFACVYVRVCTQQHKQQQRVNLIGCSQSKIFLHAQNHALKTII